MKDWLISKADQGWNWIFSSLDTHSKGMSLRKFSALALVYSIIHLSFKWCNESNIEMILLTNGGLACVLLGIVAYTDLKKSPPPTDTPPQEGA